MVALTMYGCSNNNNSSTIDEATPDVTITSTKDEIQEMVTAEISTESNTQSTTIALTVATTEQCNSNDCKMDKDLYEDGSCETLEYDVYSDYEDAELDDFYSNKYSENTVDLVARTIYCEAGSCSEKCQWLVGSTILNLADSNGGITSVVFNKNIFNVSDILYTKTPSALSYNVANRVLSGDRDYNVNAFRTDYYHSFGRPYTNIDNVYFSTF